MNAKVLVLMSTYNGEKYIEEQLNSLLSQTYKEIDILIRDDGSVDRTVDIIGNYINRNKDRIALIKGENIGVVNSFFTLIDWAKSTYSYFAFCDQDDYWEKNKIEEAIKKINKLNKNFPTMYCSNKKIVDSSLNIIKKQKNIKIEPSFNNAIVENIATGCTILINKNLLEILKIKKNTEKIIMHDWWIYLVATAFGKVIFDNNAYILYRQHANNVVGSSTFIKRIKNHIFDRNKTKLRNQAIEFYETYKLLLEEEKKKKIEKFIQYNTVFQKIIFLIKREYYRQSFLDNIIFSILYIVGKC